ncbi:hypothetical protein M2164_005022 [Streptomyces sp. SAI-208]|uniref:hypothetical protein n=1 Tax=Streptomyces sp. SAI-208 TaxID=2940550 RepID=UPI0024771E06|nr:hypothetical protein [Streptomyces sp. SAI-208]MDH6609387.1 hypothetical protein [Streptomyces sp. SAI-208]
MRRTALAALCIAAAATAGLTGCQPGQDKADSSTNASTSAAAPGKSAAKKEPFAGLSGGEIADRATKATTGASSLRMKGDIPDDESGTAISLDVLLNKKGDCAGTIGMGGKGKADLIKTGDIVYMKFDEAFLREQSEGEPKADTDAAVAMLAGKWTKSKATGTDAKEFEGFCDLGAVLDGAGDTGSDASRGKTATVDEAPAITLHEKDGKDRYTLYVATEGKPYLLRVDSTAGADQGSVTFSDFDEPVPTQKPAGEILDLDALGG